MSAAKCEIAEGYLCPQCNMVRPRSYFGYKAGGLRRYAGCERCRKALRENKPIPTFQDQLIEARKQLGLMVENYNQKIASPQPAHISELTNAMLARFGGMEGFVIFWHESILEARAAGKHKAVLDGLTGVKNLIRESSQHEQKDRQYAHISSMEVLREHLDFIIYLQEKGTDEERNVIDSFLRIAHTEDTNERLDEPAEPVGG